MTLKFDPPPLVDEKLVPTYLQGWLRRFYNQVLGATATGLAWTALNFTASNITDIITRNHNNLQNIQGGSPGESFHLTAAQNSGLTGTGDTTLHFHLADRNETHVPFLMLATPLTL